MKDYDITIPAGPEEPVPCGIDAAAPTCEATPLVTVTPDGTPEVPSVPVPVESTSTPFVEVLPGTGGGADIEGAALTLFLCACLVLVALAAMLRAERKPTP